MEVTTRTAPISGEIGEEMHGCSFWSTERFFAAKFKILKMPATIRTSSQSLFR